MSKNTFVIVLFFLFAKMSFAVSLPQIFQDNMVLQQNEEVKIWGFGKPGESISISTTWSDVVLETKVDNQANWQVILKTPKADNNTHTVRVKGYNEIVLTEVVLGGSLALLRSIQYGMVRWSWNRR